MTTATATATATDDAGHKALESAADFIKITTGLATGTLVFSINLTSAPDVLTPAARAALTACWISLLISIFLGVFVAQGRLTTKIANRSYDIHHDRILTIPTVIHQWSFFIGVMLLGATLALVLHEQPATEPLRVDSAARAVVVAAAALPARDRIVKVATVELLKGVQANDAAMATWHVQFEVRRASGVPAPAPTPSAYLDVFINPKSGAAIVP